MRLCTLVFIFTGAGISATAADLQSLLSKPPFDSIASGVAAPTGSSGPIEFRGVLREGPRWSFCLYNVQAKSSMWVGLQESGQAYFVKSYDAAKDTIQVEFSHSTYHLPLRIATTPATVPVPAGVGPVPTRTGNSPTSGPIPMPTSGTGPTVIGESGGPESAGARDMRNMERLAREAARLRAERARNLNSTPPPKQQ